jgi:sortase A
MSRRRLWALVGIWVVVVLAVVGLVLYVLAPLFQARNQQSLLEDYRAEITRAANAGSGLPGLAAATKAPEPGSPVGILEIGDLELQQVIVEGATSGPTQAGPGHVAGTAGPGQPGNSVVVGRRQMFGGPFRGLERLEPGDRILVTTTQGQSVYEVETVEQKKILPPVDLSDPASTASSLSTGVSPLANAESTIDIDELYGPTTDDRLTLVTSASALPTNSERATIVIAKLQGQPYEPTPQGGRTDSGTGLSGDATAWAPLILSLLAFGASAAGAVLLYRRTSARVAWLLTTPPLIVFSILMAESLSRLFPAWA